jgi:hypothetical protein
LRRLFRQRVVSLLSRWVAWSSIENRAEDRVSWLGSGHVRRRWLTWACTLRALSSGARAASQVAHRLGAPDAQAGPSLAAESPACDRRRQHLCGYRTAVCLSTLGQAGHDDYSLAARCGALRPRSTALAWNERCAAQERSATADAHRPLERPSHRLARRECALVWRYDTDGAPGVGNGCSVWSRCSRSICSRVKRCRCVRQHGIPRSCRPSVTRSPLFVSSSGRSVFLGCRLTMPT